MSPRLKRHDSFSFCAPFCACMLLSGRAFFFSSIRQTNKRQSKQPDCRHTLRMSHLHTTDIIVLTIGETGIFQPQQPPALVCATNTGCTQSTSSNTLATKIAGFASTCVCARSRTRSRLCLCPFASSYGPIRPWDTSLETGFGK